MRTLLKTGLEEKCASYSQSLSAFCPCPKTFCETEFKDSILPEPGK